MLLPCLITVSFLLVSLLLRLEDPALVVDCFAVLTVSVLGAVSGLLTVRSDTVVAGRLEVPAAWPEEVFDSFLSVAVAVGLRVDPAACPEEVVVSFLSVVVVVDLRVVPVGCPEVVFPSFLSLTVVVDLLVVPLLCPDVGSVFLPLSVTVEDDLLEVLLTVPEDLRSEAVPEPEDLLVTLFPEEVVACLSG